MKILVIENELLVAEHLSILLSGAGFDIVGRATTARKAIELAVAHAPDIIIMDIKLDGAIDGIEATAEIKKKKNIPVIYVTDLDNKKTIERAELTNPAAYLVKPFGERQILASIHQALFNASHKQKGVIEDKRPVEENEFFMDDSLFLRLDTNRFRKVLVNDILYIKAGGAYAEIHTTDSVEKYLYSTSMNHIFDKMKRSCLVRVHKSFVVNMNKVTEIKGNTLLIQQIEIPIGETYKNTIMGSFSIVK